MLEKGLMRIDLRFRFRRVGPREENDSGGNPWRCVRVNSICYSPLAN